jgi:hypothetical protein
MAALVQLTSLLKTLKRLEINPADRWCTSLRRNDPECTSGPTHPMRSKLVEGAFEAASAGDMSTQTAS